MCTAGWEGNHRSGVELAMRHELKWFIHLRAQRPRVGDEHPAYAPAGAWFPLQPLAANLSLFLTLNLFLILTMQELRLFIEPTA